MKEHLSPIYIFRAAIGTMAAVFLYIVATTFIPIPKDNMRIVDLSSGILIGMGNIAAGWLFTSGPPKKSTSSVPGTTNVDLSVSSTPNAEDKTEET